jgi:hypothetical protein
MLHGWENFFIAAATAGATLIGLLFVAITLGVGLSTPHGLHVTQRAVVSSPGALKAVRRILGRGRNRGGTLENE